jgi:hypothetical protein
MGNMTHLHSICEREGEFDNTDLATTELEGAELGHIGLVRCIRRRQSDIDPNETRKVSNLSGLSIACGRRRMFPT